MIYCNRFLTIIVVTSAKNRQKTFDDIFSGYRKRCQKFSSGDTLICKPFHVVKFNTNVPNVLTPYREVLRRAFLKYA